MKKISGKALSLVLSLALVVSSFSAIPAAAATKTMSGIVNDQLQDDLYLVNGGKSKTIDLNTALVDASDTLETNTRDEVDAAKVAAISHVSGDSLVSLSLSGDDNDTATLKLKSSTADGTEVISVLYSGDYTDEDGNEYTVKARKNVTIHVYDKDAIVFGEAGYKDSGDPSDAPDDFKTFAKTRNYNKDLGLYVAEPNDGADADSSTAAPVYKPVYLIGTTTDKDTAAAVQAIQKTGGVVYSADITTGEDDVHFGTALSATPKEFDASGTDLTNPALKAIVGKTPKDPKSAWDLATNPYTKDASTTNVTLTLKKVESTGKISTDSDDKYTLKTKVDSKVDVTAALLNVDPKAVTSGLTFTVEKSDGKSRIDSLLDGAKDIDVTDDIVVFPAGTSKVTVDEDTNLKGIEGEVGDLSIGDGRVSYVDIDKGNVELSDGKVGDITIGETDDSSASDGNVTIDSGTAGNIDTTNVDSAIVTINGGTVGDVVSKASITVDSTDEDTKVATGQLKAPTVDVYSDEAAVTIGSIFAKADDGTITLKGSAVTVKAIDLDSRNTNLQLGDDSDSDYEFTGSIPAPKNATNATLTTSNEDSRVTVNGSLNIDTINLDSDTSTTFDSAVTADTIEGDGTMVIKAGNLYVTGSVSSTRLKLSDTSLAAGTVVFKADADEVDADDFEPYGFTLTKSEGTNVDTFKIDTLSFAGLQITGGPAEVVVGNSASYTASAYPGGTTIPTGYTVGWELDGGSSDVFDLTTNGNVATVKVNSIDTDFASENHTTLTATLYDEDGYEVDTDTYGNATFDITAVATPSVNYTSDTTGTVNMKVGGVYQFKITSNDGTVPNFVVAGNGGARVTGTSVSGHDYFYKVTAQKAGQYGVYVNNGPRVAVLNITSDAKIDTTAVTIKLGSTYQFKVTSSATPTFGLGSTAATTISSSVSGTSHFYKVKATGKVGDKVGVYVDGSLAATITVG